MSTDPFPELDPDRAAVDWLRNRVAEQLAADPDGPTLLDAIDTAQQITAGAEQETDERFWDIVRAA